MSENAPPTATTEPAKNDPAPEIKYDLKLPDGYDNKHAIERAVADSKELGLNQEKAQAYLNKLASMDLEHRKAVKEAQEETFKTWEKSIKEDQQFGGDKFEATNKEVQRALGKFATASDIEELTQIGGLKSPALVRILARAGRVLSDDSTSRASSSSSARSSYPKTMSDFYAS